MHFSFHLLLCSSFRRAYLYSCLLEFKTLLKFLLADGESSGRPPSDRIAMMEFYMNKAAQEERKRQPRQSKDEMPPPASLQGHGSCTVILFSSYL